MNPDKKEKIMKNNQNQDKTQHEEINEPANTPRDKVSSEQDVPADENLILIGKLQNEVNEYKDRLLRKAAEFENYKRRTENDQLNLFKYAAESFIIKLLPVADDFERSLAHIDNNETKDINAVKEGIRLVYDKLMKIFTDQGITKIDAVGKPFDVHFHEALMQKKAENVPPHTVIEELETGYIYKDKVIRHSKVVVSEETPEGSAGTDSNSANKDNQ
jgi:molecular chaperone GrpE